MAKTKTIILMMLSPRHWFSSFTSAIYIVPVVVFTVIWNIPRFAELTTCYNVSNVTVNQVIIEVRIPLGEEWCQLSCQTSGQCVVRWMCQRFVPPVLGEIFPTPGD